MSPRLPLLILVAVATACAGGPDVADPLAPVPTDVDPRDVAPPQLRQAWSVQLAPDDLETAEEPEDEDEEDTLRPTAAPALDAANAYVVFGERLVALDVEDGSIRWEVAAPGPIVVAPVPSGDGVSVASEGRWTWVDTEGRVTGVLGADGAPRVAVAAGDALVEIRGAEVRALTRDPGTGPAVAWARPLEEARSLTATADGSRVLVADAGGTLHALDVATGERRWQQERAEALPAPVAVDDRRAYVAGRDRRLRALRLRDGDLQWRSRPFGVDLAGGPAVADGVVWVGGMSSVLQGLDADSGSALHRVNLSSRSYLDLVRWGRWIVASPTYGPWTVVRAPLRPLSPSNPGSPVSYTISSGDNEILRNPAVGPQGVLVVDAGGNVRLVTPQERGPLSSPQPAQGEEDGEGGP